MEAITNFIRLSKGRPNGLFLSLTALVGIVLLWEIGRLGSQPKFPIGAPRFVVVTHDVPVGRILEVSDLGMVPTSQLSADFDRRGLVTDQDLDYLRNGRTRVTFRKGDLVRFADIIPSGHLSRQIPPGKRAYASQVGGDIAARSGDLVDVFHVDDSPGGRSELVVEAVEVLRAGDDGLVLALTPPQIERMEKAKQTGKLTVVLRNPQESSSIVSGPGGAKRAPRPKKTSIKIQAESE